MNDEQVTDIMTRAVHIARSVYGPGHDEQCVAIMAAAAMRLVKPRTRKVRAAVVVAEEVKAKDPALAAAADSFGSESFTMADLSERMPDAIDTKGKEMSVGQALHAMGYTKRRTMISGTRNSRWQKQ
jgi:hypothetical protein